MQLYIEPELDNELRRLATIRRVSKAHLLREGARRVVQEEQSQEADPLLAIVDLVKSKGGRKENVSVKHDDYLARWELAGTRKPKG
ncbi:MAG: hypothetical protein HY673_08035 [Chloroflexi bacterium]|nr:hypothetical protein [Chloroflexota bacterium]